MHLQINIIANIPKLIVNGGIGNTNDRKAIGLQKGGPFFVVLFSCLVIMSAAVQFNYQLRLSGLKIYNIVSQHLLPGETSRVGPQIIIPKVPLFLGHVFSQHFCGRDKFSVVLPVHGDPSVKK